MIGSALNIGLSMAAFAASAKAVRTGAAIVSSNFRRTVKGTVDYISKKKLISPDIESKLKTITSDRSFDKAKEFYTKAIDGSKASIQRKVTPSTYKHLSKGMGILKDEAMYMPANYIYYRMDKYRASSPEEKEATSSFAKYYLGAPMMFSIAAGRVMNQFSISKTVSKHILPKIDKGKRTSILKGIEYGARGGAVMMDKSIAAVRTMRKKTGGQGITGVLSLIGNRSQNKEKFGTIFRDELRKLRTEPSLYEKRQAEISSFNYLLDSNLEYLKKTSKGRRNYKELKTASDMIKAETAASTIQGYKSEMDKETTFMKFMNGIADNLKDERFRTKRYVNKEGVAENFGKYVVGEKVIDFGRMNTAFMKDLLITSSTSSKGPALGPKFFIGLFNQTEILKYQHSEQALSTAFTKTNRRSNINLGKAYYDIDNRKTAEELTGSIVGINPLDTTLNPAAKEMLAMFHESRRNIAMSRNKIDAKNIDLGDVVLKSHYRRGEVPLGSNEILVHFPGGDLKLFTTLKDSEGKRHPATFQLGGLSDGQFMKYYKFTRESNSAAAMATRNLFGRESISLGKDNNATIGPTPLGSVIRDSEDKSLIGSIKNALDIGYSKHRWLGTILGSVVGKLRDPRYAKTFFDDSYIGNKDLRKVISENINVQIDTAKMLSDESQNAMDHFVAKTTKKVGGSEAFVSLLEGNELLDTASGVDLSKIFVHDNMTAGNAKTRINSAMKVLRQYRKDKGLDNTFFKEFEGSLESMRTLFTESHDYEKVYNIISGVETGKRMFINMKYTSLSKVDEYNSSILSFINSIDGQGSGSSITSHFKKTFALNHSKPKEISEFAAASNMSKFHHKLSIAINSEYEAAILKPNIVNSNKAVESLLEYYSDPTNKETREIREYFNKSWRHSNIAPNSRDPRAIIEESPYEEIFAIPKSGGSGIVGKRLINTAKGPIEVAEGIMDASNVSIMGALYAFNRVAEESMGLGLDETRIATPYLFAKELVTKRILPGIAAYMGYNILDKFFDQTMDGTPLGEGLTVFGANILASARLSSASILDTVGITDASKYLEDLMPGFISSPLSGAARFLGPIGLGLSIGHKYGGTAGSLKGGFIGTAVGALIGGGPLGIFGNWNIDKSRAEVIDILSGTDEVPIRKGRWWELGQTSFEGTRVQYYRPHMYAMLRADYKNTPNFKDSMFKETIGALAPDIYGMQNYYTRPYPVTAGLFSDIPVISNMASMIPFLPIGGGLEVNNNYSDRYMSKFVNLPSEGYGNGIGIDNISEMHNTGEGFNIATSNSLGLSGRERAETFNFEEPFLRSEFQASASRSMRQAQDIIGMRGFLIGSMYESVTGRSDLYDYNPEMATPIDIAGITRSYWDMEIGGFLGMSEAFRRFVPRERSQVEIFNPIVNAMPTWLPDEQYMTDFWHGDPFTQIPMGEARLPGPGYETLKDVDIAMPMVADMLAYDNDSQLAYYLGFPEFMVPLKRKKEIAKTVADEIRERAIQTGDLLKEESSVYNASLDIHATVEMILGGNQGKIPVKVAPTGLGGENALNAFLVISGMTQGMLMEVDPESGAVTEKMISKDIEMFMKDISRTQKSRMEAYKQMGSMDRSSKNINLGNAYSWFDRYRILADVAMYSEEFKEAEAIVKQQMDAGYLRGDHIIEYLKIGNQLQEKRKAYDFSEYRFLNLGQHLSESGKQRDAEIMEKYSPMERAIGGAWEYISHLRTPIHSKMLHKRSALEEYEASVVYGKTIPMWENPYEDFIKSYYYRMMGESDPVQGALSWGTGGMLLGGLPLSGIMAVAGAAVSGTNALTGNVFIPDRTQQVREIMSQMDATEYAKYQRLYHETGNPEYLKKADRTMTGYAQNGIIPAASFAGSAYGGVDKHFLEDIMENVTRSNLERVSQIIPDEMVPVLYNHIGNEKRAKQELNRVKEDRNSRILPDYSSPIYSKNVPIEVPAIQTFEMEGLNAHDANMGWASQIAQTNRLISSNQYRSESLYSSFMESGHSIKEINTSINESNRIRSALLSLAKNVMIVQDGSSSVEVEIII